MCQYMNFTNVLNNSKIDSIVAFFMKVNPRLFIISAPSGGGKTSVTKCIIEKLVPFLPIKKVTTCTSRPARSEEVEGREYHFISHQEFIDQRTAGFFLESTLYNGYFYGSPKHAFNDLKNNTTLIMVATRDGAQYMKKVFHDAVLIWIMAPNLHTLRQRVRSRGRESAEEIEERMAIAQHEIDDETLNPIFDYHVMNVDFEKTVQEICSLILKEISL